MQKLKFHNSLCSFGKDQRSMHGFFWWGGGGVFVLFPGVGGDFFVQYVKCIPWKCPPPPPTEINNTNSGMCSHRSCIVIYCIVSLAPRETMFPKDWKTQKSDPKTHMSPCILHNCTNDITGRTWFVHLTLLIAHEDLSPNTDRETVTDWYLFNQTYNVNWEILILSDEESFLTTHLIKG